MFPMVGLSVNSRVPKDLEEITMDDMYKTHTHTHHKKTVAIDNNASKRYIGSYEFAFAQLFPSDLPSLRRNGESRSLLIHRFVPVASVVGNEELLVAFLFSPFIIHYHPLPY